MTKAKDILIREYTSREKTNLLKLKRNLEGTKLLLELFDLGFTSVGALKGVMILYFPKYKNFKEDARLKEAWYGQFRFDYLIDDLKICLENAKKIKQEKE